MSQQIVMSLEMLSIGSSCWLRENLVRLLELTVPCDTLQAQLRRHRTQLDIKTGSVSDPVLPPDEGKELKEVTKGPMFRKFFQSPGEEDDGSASQDVQQGLPDVSPAELWFRVRAVAA